MRFSDILPALETGRRVRRPHWGSAVYMDRKCRMAAAHVGGGNGESELSMSDLLADDWEVVPEEPANDCPRDWSAIKADYLESIAALNRANETIARLERELREARGALLMVKDLVANVKEPS